MKKSIIKKSICTFVAGASIAVFSLSAFAAVNDVYVGNDKIGSAFDNGKNIMVPLRAVAEKLGYDVSWNDENEGVKLDNGEVNTVVYIGADSYYMASSKAIGMSAPESLGAAPEIKDGITFVPAKMFDVLLCGESSYKTEDGKIVFNKEENAVEIPNPFTEYKTVDEAKKALSFDAKLPSAIPAEFKLEYISVMQSSLLNLVYRSADGEINYRTAVGTEDISGDYTVYKTVKNVKIGNSDVEIRMDGSDFEGKSVCGAVWNDGENSYSVYSNADLSEDELTDIVKNIK